MTIVFSQVLTATRPPRTPFWLLLSVLTATVLLLALCSLTTGAASVPWSGLLQLFSDNAEPASQHIVWQLRLPRTLLALLVGVHFALAGLILQTVIRNPLADPGVIGVSGGASLMIVVVLLLSDYLQVHWLAVAASPLPLGWLPLAALAGGLASALLVLQLGWRSGLEPARLALYGVAIGALLNAAVMWTILAWGGGRTELSLSWLAGSLYGRGYAEVLTLLPWTLGCALLYLCLLKPLALLRFPDHSALSLGLAVRRWRLLALLLAVMLAASAIAVTGPVGFVGLIVPHLARLLLSGRMAGGQHAGGYLLKLSLLTTLCGAGLMLAADIVGRTLVSPLELPAGVLTTLLGMPLMLWLLQRQSGHSIGNGTHNKSRSSAC